MLFQQNLMSNMTNIMPKILIFFQLPSISFAVSEMFVFYFYFLSTYPAHNKLLDFIILTALSNPDN